jgi:DNA/RNA endonuclease YhcR with UshA esterase domain
MCRVPLLLLVLAVSAGPLFSADEPQIDSADALNHIRESVTVSGLVVAVFVSKHGNAFINFGAAYPNQTFADWLPAGTPLASDPWLRQLQGKTIKITGTIKLYQGKPEIKITSRNQIVSE